LAVALLLYKQQLFIKDISLICADLLCFVVDNYLIYAKIILYFCIISFFCAISRMNFQKNLVERQL